MGAMTLYGEPGWGSAIVETQLAWYGMNFDFVAVGDVFRSTDSYPTYTYADEPTKFIANAECATEFAGTVHLHAQSLYRMLNDAATEPWFLGDSISAMDFYIGTMTHVATMSSLVPSAHTNARGHCTAHLTIARIA